MVHCIDICKVNAWLIYRRYCEPMEITKKRQLSLLKFTYNIATALINAGRTVNPFCRPSKRKSAELDVIPVGIYMFKVNNRNTSTRCEICSKLIIMTP